MTMLSASAGAAWRIVRRSHFVAIVAFLFTAGPDAALAAVRYERLVSEGGVPYVIIAGEFDPRDVIADFVSAATAHKALFISFDSHGGSIYSAISHGRMIRALGINTIQTRDLQCTSACALAFLGGVTRTATPGALGVHQHSFTPDSQFGRDEAVAAAHEVTADVLAYLSEMGVDAGLMQLALRYGRGDMRYLSGAEMADFRVTTSLSAPTVAAEPLAPAMPAAPAPVYADVPIPTWAPTERPPATPAPSLPPDGEIVGFVRSVLETHSQDDDLAIRNVIKAYARTVNYFGKPTALREIVADKRAYFKRWPDRTYAIREPSLEVSCRAQVCEVSGNMDWTVRSVPRKKDAFGAASFRYAVDVSRGMIIVSEDSAILRE